MDKLTIPAHRFYAKPEKRIDAKEFAHKRRTYREWGGNRSENGEEFYCDGVAGSLRSIGDANRVAPISVKHTGWYVSHFHDNGVIRGHVLRLPARKGVDRFLAMTYQTDSDGVTLHVRQTFDDPVSAAIYADDCARYAAEREREANAKQQAENDIEDIQEDIKTARRACLKLLREMRAIRTSTGERTEAKPENWTTPTICNVLRARVMDYLEEIKTARERIAALESNYWLAVERF